MNVEAVMVGISANRRKNEFVSITCRRYYHCTHEKNVLGVDLMHPSHRHIEGSIAEREECILHVAAKGIKIRHFKRLRDHSVVGNFAHVGNVVRTKGRAGFIRGDRQRGGRIWIANHNGGSHTLEKIAAAIGVNASRQHALGVWKARIATRSQGPRNQVVGRANAATARDQNFRTITRAQDRSAHIAGNLHHVDIVLGNEKHLAWCQRIGGKRGVGVLHDGKAQDRLNAGVQDAPPLPPVLRHGDGWLVPAVDEDQIVARSDGKVVRCAAATRGHRVQSALFQVLDVGGVQKGLDDARGVVSQPLLDELVKRKCGVGNR